jgi:hypothetical protein
MYRIKGSDFPLSEHNLLFMYWTYYWMGVWMKMILQTLSLSTSSAIKECCLLCRDVIYCTRSLVDFYTIGQQTNWNVGLLLPHYTVSLPAWSLYSQQITVYYLLIIYNHHKVICLYVVYKSAPRLFQNRINRKIQDSVHLQLTVYSLQLWSQWHYYGTESGEVAANGKANILGRMPSFVRG